MEERVRTLIRCPAIEEYFVDEKECRWCEKIRRGGWCEWADELRQNLVLWPKILEEIECRD